MCQDWGSSHPSHLSAMCLKCSNKWETGIRFDLLSLLCGVLWTSRITQFCKWIADLCALLLGLHVWRGLGPLTGKVPTLDPRF